MLAPQLEFAFETVVDVDAPMDLGVTAAGHRRIIAIRGGTFEGPQIKGEVLAGGADWQIVHSDGSAELDARYTLRTDQGALIYVVNRGLRNGPPEVMRKLAAGEPVDPSTYYFRSAAFFETSAPECQWLTKSIVVGAGERRARQVVIRFWKLL